MNEALIFPTLPPEVIAARESAIRRVVGLFYDRVKTDELLGPVFAPFMAANWDAHLERMCDFWSMILCQTSRYKGKPMQAHLQLAGLSPAHFERWLALFTATVKENCEASLGEMFIERATRMRENLQAAVLRAQANAAG